MLAWFGGTDKGGKVGRALIAGGREAPAGQDRKVAELSRFPAPRPLTSSSPSKWSFSDLGSAAGQTCPFSRVIHRLTLSTFAASPDQLLKGHGTETMSGKKKPNNWSQDAFIAQVLGSYKIKVFWVSLFTDQVTRPWTLNPWSTSHEYADMRKT